MIGLLLWFPRRTLDHLFRPLEEKWDFIAAETEALLKEMESQLKV